MRELTWYILPSTCASSVDSVNVECQYQKPAPASSSRITSRISTVRPVFFAGESTGFCADADWVAPCSAAGCAATPCCGALWPVFCGVVWSMLVLSVVVES